MSIKVMSAVWANAPVRGGRLLILLALADFANDNGICWPSVETLGKKARLKRRQTQDILKKLRDTRLVVFDKGTGPHGVNTYKVNPEGVQFPHPVQVLAQGVRQSAKRGAAHRTQTVIEPSLEEPSSAYVPSTLERHEKKQREKVTP